MRTLLQISSLLTVQFTFGQLAPGTYKLTGDTASFGGGVLFSTISVNTDKTFIYQYRNTTSCFLWYDIKGKWSASQDTLIFVDTTLNFEETHRVENYINTSQDNILILVKTKTGKPVKGAKVSYAFSATKDAAFYYTNSKGQVQISRLQLNKNKLPKADSVDYEMTFTIEYVNNNKEKVSSNNYFKGISNFIECSIAENPKIDTLLRTTKYKIENDRIEFLSQSFDKEGKQFLENNWGDFKLNIK